MFEDDDLEEFADAFEDLEELEEHFNFEMKFYTHVAGTKNFDVIPYPEGVEDLSPKHLKLLELNIKKEGKKVLYRVSHGKFATVYDNDTKKVGVLPEDNFLGFEC